MCDEGWQVANRQYTRPSSFIIRKRDYPEKHQEPHACIFRTDI
jgi:hypothetical protein